MTPNFLPYGRQGTFCWRTGCSVLGLFTLTALAASTALGNHLENHSIFDIHKPDEGTWYSQDPTLQQFLNPGDTSEAPPRAVKNTEPSLEPAPAVPPSPKEMPKVMTDQNPGVPPLTQGWTFLLNGQPEAALSAYQQALSGQPDSAKALLGMGMTFKAIGKMDEAKEALTQALELNPRLASALVHLGYLYLYADGPSGSSNPETARRLFQDARQMGDPFAHIALLDLQAHFTL